MGLLIFVDLPAGLWTCGGFVFRFSVFRRARDAV
jgi:hypothetical protein